MSISGNLVGSYSQIGKTFVLVDDAGNEFTGVVTDNMQVFDATDNDVRTGKTYVSDIGPSTGTKDIPAYETTKASYIIFAGEDFEIPLVKKNKYDYTQFQCIISKFNTTLNNSVETDRIGLNNCVYLVNSTNALSNITKDHDSKSIRLNIINNSEHDYVVHYFTYKKED